MDVLIRNEALDLVPAYMVVAEVIPLTQGIVHARRIDNDYSDALDDQRVKLPANSLCPALPEDDPVPATDRALGDGELHRHGVAGLRLASVHVSLRSPRR